MLASLYACPPPMDTDNNAASTTAQWLPAKSHHISGSPKAYTADRVSLTVILAVVTVPESAVALGPRC